MDYVLQNIAQITGKFVDTKIISQMTNYVKKG